GALRRSPPGRSPQRGERCPPGPVSSLGGAICADAVKTGDTSKPQRRIAAIGGAFAFAHDLGGAALVKLAGPRVTHRDLLCGYHPCAFCLVLSSDSNRSQARRTHRQTTGRDETIGIGYLA